ncbi:MAG: 1-deoxy-D-xylulose-5-phosphate synthase, partial [Butyrivibrio sp.]|nr:1-deoxy-D-xylulose-5-phosphate synthase [Butyrivibrio sp.]
MWLEQIRETNDIKKLPEEALPVLAQEIRSFLVEHLSVTGGHLGSNLGAVELTIALHRTLDLPEDKIIWDVGHQSYTHKILTGRGGGFDKLRQTGGLSGFPKKSESDTDVFETGHASNSISAGLGLVMARELAGENYTVVTVIGDGALSGGEAYEAINNASKLESNYIIILNDNNMSISEPTGGISRYLNSIRTMPGYLDLRDNVYNSLAGRRHNRMIEHVRRAKNSVKQLFVPGMFFEQLDATYLGPVDGHDISALTRALKAAGRVRKAVVVHVVTKKGKGYPPAENHPARFHGTDPYHIENGVPIKRKKAAYQDIFSTVMIKLAERDEKVVAITAAMAEGTGLKRFRNIYPDRFFDVGIAEAHAVTFAAGLALGGYKPVVAVYSTFLQRAYDQVMQDVCMQHLPVVFAIDRAGIVGADGETHQGMFDLSYLTTIPNLTVLAPKNKWELSDMMKYAVALGKPCAIRYPRG